MLATGAVDELTTTAFEEEAEAFALMVREGLIAQEAPPAEWMFDWVYAEPPAAFLRQRDEALS
jgi:hypothetical protein